MADNPESEKQRRSFFSSAAIGGRLLQKLRVHYFLLITLLLFSVVVSVTVLAIVPPKYTASAVVGPVSDTLDQDANPLGSVGGGLSGLVKHGGLAAALSGGGGNMFDQYTQLLPSNRIAAWMAADQNVMRSIFYKKYDWDEHHWKSRNDIFHETVDFFKQLIHYPVKLSPDQDDVMKFLTDELNVDAPLTSSFATVTLKAKNPQEAEWLLNVVLLDADTMIRADKKRDVDARIKYLTAIIPNVTQADQKNILIQVLSTQEQTMMELEADNRYASTVVDKPHADLKPTSPPMAAIFGGAFLLSAGVWALLVFLLRDDHWFHVRFSRTVSKLPRFRRSRAYASIQ